MDVSRSSTKIRKGFKHNVGRASKIGLGEDGAGTHSKSGLKGELGSSRVNMSHAGRSKTEVGNTVSIKDDVGADVTPISLFARAMAPKQRDVTASVSEMSMSSLIMKETVSDVLNQLEQLSTQSWTSSIGGGKSQQASFAQSHGGSVYNSITEDKDDDASSAASGDESADELGDHFASKIILPGISMEKKERAVDPDEIIHLVLTETETMVLIDIPSVCVHAESIEEITLVKANNARYKELKAARTNNDNFVSRGMQTFDNPLKTKDVQAVGPAMINAEVNVNQWDIYDEFDMKDKSKNDTERAELEIEGVPIELVTSNSTMSGSASIMEDSRTSINSRSIVRSQSIVQNENGSISSAAGSVTNNHAQAVAAIQREQNTVNALQREQAEKDSFLSANKRRIIGSLELMEKAVLGNNYVKKLISYRNVVDWEKAEEQRIAELIRRNNIGENEDENNLEQFDATLAKTNPTKNDMDGLSSNIPTLGMLWSYRCELTRGRNVTCLSWNKQNEDILAVAYGESRVHQQSCPGLILCWSVKNPEWPERIFECASSVTSLDFSRLNPGLLAAGFMDGRVIIFDVKKGDDQQVLEDEESLGKHFDPVWELKWIEKERVAGDDQSRVENLVSVSTDGRVTQWMIRKGLQFNDLMTLKRITKQETSSAGAGVGVKTTSFISRQAGGLCFDFNPKDSNIYLVGTEDGHIHKCSCSYNEQYLLNYTTHTGPVNKVKWSPFLPSVFLSCSVDWTVRLWNQDSEEEVFKFQSGKDTVSDIAWSPHSSTTFASVSSDGRLELWDLNHSVLDPVINHNVLDRQLTCVSFATQSSVVITGDDYGAVTFYKLGKVQDLAKEAGTVHTEKDPQQQQRESVPFRSWGSGAINDSVALEWRAEQAHILTHVIMSKNTVGGVSASGTGTSSTSNSLNASANNGIAR